MGNHTEGELLPDGYFLPYQNAWISDDSRFKLWDKSRRIGATYAESYRACRRRNMIDEKRDYWFSSADDSAAYEYAQTCRSWCEIIDAVVKEIFEELEDSEGYRYNNYVLEFPNGSRINCMTSNPRRFRSKGGDADLDEFDWHDQPGAMLDAATPITTWGFDISIMTTRNGEGSEFDRLVKMAQKIQSGHATAEELHTLPWSYHSTPLTTAIQQGLAEKVSKLKNVTFAVRKAFYLECRARCRNEDAFNQEYMCIPSSAASVLIPYDLYQSCEADNILQQFGDGEQFLGFDVGREHDPSVCWHSERVGDILTTRSVDYLLKQKYHVQKQFLADKLQNPKVLRLCVDATGIGDMLAEELQREFGEHRVEKVKFTAPLKEVMAGRGVGFMEDRRVRLPADRRIRESFHRVRKTVTAAGNVRLDADRTDEGHVDDWWAFALMLEAAHQPADKPECILL